MWKVAELLSLLAVFYNLGHHRFQLKPLVTQVARGSSQMFYLFIEREGGRNRGPGGGGLRWGAHLHNGAAEQKIYDRSGVYRPLGHPARCVQFCFSSPICLSNIEEFAGVCLSREHALCQVEPPLRTAFHRVSLRRNHTLFSVIPNVVPFHTFTPCPRLYHLYVLLSAGFLFAGITPCSQLFHTLFLSTPSHLVPGCTAFTYCFPPGFSSPESHLVLSCSLRCSSPHLHTLSQVVPLLHAILSTGFLFAGITPCSQLFLTLFLSTPSHRVVVCFVTLSIIRTLSKCCFQCSFSPSLYFVTLSLNVACFVAPRLDLR